VSPRASSKPTALFTLASSAATSSWSTCSPFALCAFVGLSTATALGELGAKVAICGRKKDKLEAAEQKLRAEAQQRIDGAEERLRQVDPAKLASGQQDSLQTVQSFVDKAREALQTQDVQRAFTLADKAYLLADELVRRPR